jgi:long-chain acyl-CoA synthetase
MSNTAMGALLHQAQMRPRSAALVFREEIWTYQRLLAEADCLARGLSAHGIKPGDRVALHLANRPEMIVACYACFRLGAIASPLQTTLDSAELGPILRRLKPALYIGESGLIGNVAPVETLAIASDRRFIVGETAAPGVREWEELFDGAEGETLPNSPPPSQPAVLIDVSGTTGEPNFVLHTPAMLSVAVDLTLGHFGFSDDDILIEPLPIAHISGLIALLSFIAKGAPVVLVETLDPDAALDAIERYRGTWYAGIAAQYAALLDRQREGPRDLASLRICLTGADACPVDLQERLSQELGVPLYNLIRTGDVNGSLSYGQQRGRAARMAPAAPLRLSR